MNEARTPDTLALHTSHPWYCIVRWLFLQKESTLATWIFRGSPDDIQLSTFAHSIRKTQNTHKKRSSNHANQFNWCKWISPASASLLFLYRISCPVSFLVCSSLAMSCIDTTWEQEAQTRAEDATLYLPSAGIDTSNKSQNIIALCSTLAFKILSLNGIIWAKSIKTISFVIKINWRLWVWCARCVCARRAVQCAHIWHCYQSCPFSLWRLLARYLTHFLQ